MSRQVGLIEKCGGYTKRPLDKRRGGAVRQLGSLDELRHIGIGPLGVYLVRHLARSHAAFADEKQPRFSVREYCQNRPNIALDDRLTGTISATVYGPILELAPVPETGS